MALWLHRPLSFCGMLDHQDVAAANAVIHLYIRIYLMQTLSYGNVNLLFHPVSRVRRENSNRKSDDGENIPPTNVSLCVCR